MLCRNFTKTSASSSKTKMMSQEITLCKLLAREVIRMDAKSNSTLFTVSAVCLVYMTLKSSMKIMQELLGEKIRAWRLRSCNSNYL